MKAIVLTEQEIARFWETVDVRGPDDCWAWMGYISPNGYGVFGFCDRGGILVHRIAYVLTHGPTDLFVLHKPIVCHNRACCNPNHLYAGTHSDNRRDAIVDGTFHYPGRVRRIPIIRNDGVVFESLTEAAIVSGVDYKTVWNHCNGRVNPAKFQYYRGHED